MLYEALSAPAALRDSVWGVTNGLEAFVSRGIHWTRAPSGGVLVPSALEADRYRICTQNFQWLESLSLTKYQGDTLVVAGDIGQRYVTQYRMAPHRFGLLSDVPITFDS